MTTLCLVGCCRTKLRQAAPAKELYVSPLFRLCRRWAEQHADAWAVLSAYHGVVEPDAVLEPYDVTIRQRRPYGQAPLSSEEFQTWLCASVQRWRCKYVQGSQTPQLIVLAGKDYWRWLKASFTFSVPMDGLGIGERLQWLQEQLAREEGGALPPRVPPQNESLDLFPP
jgi:hypothetical protein